VALRSGCYGVSGALVVAAPERDAAAKSLDIYSSAARSTVVDEKMREFFKQRVP